MVCTASVSRWSTRCRVGWTSTSTLTRPAGDQLPARRPGRLRRSRYGGSRLVLRPRRRTEPQGLAGAKGKSGTLVRFWPDRQIFTKDAGFVWDELVGRARQTSFIVPGLELVLRDLRGDLPVEEKFLHAGGIAEFVDFLSIGQPVTEVLRLQGADTFTETVPMLDAQGHMTPQDVVRELGVDVALRWVDGYDTELRSFVNVIATPKGGTHVSGFETALTKTFNDAMRGARCSRSTTPT